MIVTAAIICIGIFVQATQAIPRPGHGALAGYCMTSSDCHSDECCVSFIQPRGKRLLITDLPPELERLVKGKCVRRGVDKPTEYCILNGAMPAQADLFYHCPCMSGFTCEGTGRMALPDGEIGTCNQTAKRALHTCSSGADCAVDECCMSDVRPIGKRANGRQARALRGHCQPMGTAGSNCFVKMGAGKPNDVVFSCPCGASLTCHGRGIFDVPLGEIGRCGA